MGKQTSKNLNETELLDKSYDGLIQKNDKKEAMSALRENSRQHRDNAAGKVLTMTDSTKSERETLYKSMVPGDAELSMELMDGPADNTRWMNVSEDPPFQCSMMGAVERIDKGKCTMTITINILIDSGQNVLEGVVVSEDFISLLGLSSKHLMKKGVRNISTADPNGPGLKVVGRVKPGLMGIRFCGHETVFVQPLVVQGLANEINVGLVFMATVGAKLNFATRTVNFGTHCERTLAKKHTEGFRFKRESGESEFNYSSNQEINTLSISNAWEKPNRYGLRMQQSGNQWEAILEGNAGQDVPDRLAVHSGPLPEDLVGAVFIPYRPDIAPTRVGKQGLTLVVPARKWKTGEVVGRLEGGTGNHQLASSSSRSHPVTDEESGAQIVTSNEISHGNKQTREVARIFDKNIETKGVSGKRMMGEDKTKRVDELMKDLRLENNAMIQQNQSANKKMKEILGEFEDVFTSSNRTVGSAPEKFEFQINVKPNSKPVKQNLRPLHPLLKENLAAQIQQWLDEDVIEPSTSP